MAPAIPLFPERSRNSLLPLLLLVTVVPFLPATDAAKCHPADRKAILQIYEDMGDPATFFRSNLSGGCCGWAGVRCGDDTVAGGGPFAGRVMALVILSNANLSATIPASIGDLPHLRTLVIRKFPNLTGPIPPAITRLTNLADLTLDWNALTGPVPHFLAQLPNLRYLNLAFNRLSGSLPPSLGTLAKLTYINLSRNNLTGPIPPSYGDLPRDIYGLILSHNALSGPIPTSLGRLNFGELDLSRNRLEGDARFLLGPAEQKTSAHTIDLSRNLLEFDLTGVDVTTARLAQLTLDHNRIRGAIPRALEGAWNLQQFNVSYNQLCGEIPRGGSFGRFGQDEFAHNKCLCGTPLPPCK